MERESRQSLSSMTAGTNTMFSRETENSGPVVQTHWGSGANYPLSPERRKRRWKEGE